MSEDLSRSWQLICAWCGPAFVITFAIFWAVLGKNLPPAGPGLSALEIATHYTQNNGSIRVGFVAAVVMVGFYMPWSAVLSVRLAAIEGKAPVMAFLQLIGGALTVMVVSMSALFWIAAAFRPERSPEMTQTLHDLGWLTIDQLYICTTMQMVAAGIVGLSDKSANPMLPRWTCFLAFWCASTFFPASMTAFLKAGPFAWNGVLSYYLPYGAWLGWFCVFSFYMIKHISGQTKRAEVGLQLQTAQ
ncbi:MAG: hypothetical protein ABWZ40_13825 [Caulobacterales bacterium]